GVGGYLLTPRVIRPAWQRFQRRRALQRHLEVLRARTSNLLNACSQVLQGEKPEETMLYQLFSAYGGEHEEELRADVWEALRRSQEALNDAFDLRQKLIDPTVQKGRSLEEQVRNWEMLYLTLVGSREEIRNLTDDELRALLDPLLVLEREPDDVQLARQLDDLRREMVGTPLKVDLMVVDPSQTDAEGILGYIDHVKGQIARLQAAQREAPERLAEAKARRQAIEKEVPSPFVMSRRKVFAALDRRLAQAEADLQAGRFLRTIRQADAIRRDLETVRAFVAAVEAHRRRQSQIEAITAQGYRPPSLTKGLEEAEADLQAIIREIEAGGYQAAASWIEELEADSRQALADAQAWQALHRQNQAALDQLRKEADRLEQYRQETVLPAWQTLQTYPQGNWADVAARLEEATQTLQALRDDRLRRIARLNSLEEQKLTEAEAELTQAKADLARTERQLQALVQRLEEVQTAERTIQEALRLTEAEVEKAIAFRDREDVKIGPAVDQQIAQARRQLEEARRLAEAREFVAAVNAQMAARQQATAAYAAATEQVQAINELQEALEAKVKQVGKRVKDCLAEAEALPAVVQTPELNKLVRQVQRGFSQAQKARATLTGLEDQALAEALKAAVAAYETVEKQVAQAEQRLNTDRRAYDRLHQAARNAVRSAQRAIRSAERTVSHPDAGRVGVGSLRRARSILPVLPKTPVSREMLARIRDQAREAKMYAEAAQQQARQRIEWARAERERKRRRERRRSSWGPGWGSSSGGGGSSWGGGSSRRRSSGGA
ncbi:MAG: hypothetical protein D6759_08935, partial [Chloroflexi bacterium]